jgi:HK97 family phage portal protein
MTTETKPKRTRKVKEKAAPAAFSPNWDASWLAAAGRNPWAFGKAAPESLSAVYGAARLLTGGLLGASVRLVRYNRDGGTERIGTGDLSAMLADLPTDQLEPCFHDLLMKGNGYLKVHRNDRGGIMWLEWLEASRCSLHREHGGRQLWLKVSPRWSDAEPEMMLPQGEFVHLAMRPSSSPIYGESPLSRLSPGMTMAVSVIESASQIMQNSVNPGAILTVPAMLKPESRQRIRDTLERQFSAGSGLAGKTLVLDMENKLERLPTAEQMLSDAFVALAQFSVSEVCRAFGVPVSLLAQGQDVNRATAEQESRSFAMFSVQPLARMIADQLSRALISPEDRRGGLRVTFDLTDSLIPVGTERAEYASKLINSGLASVNELRDYLGLGDIEGGDMLAKPVNTVPLDQWLAGPQPAAPMPAPSEAQPAPEETQRMIRREAAQHDVADRAETRLKLIMGGQAADELAARRMAGSDIETLIRRST